MKFPRLVPNADQFYTLLGELSSQACLSVQNLKSFIESRNDEERAMAAVRIDTSRAGSKSASVEITEQLCRSFVTPFDREDIHGLAENLYDIPKIVEKIKERVLLHKLSEEKGDFSRQVEIIISEAMAMEAIMEGLLSGQNKKQILDKVAVLRDLEHKGDVAHNDLVTTLFNTPRETRDLLLRRDIYDMLEKVVDRFRDGANVAFRIVLKHS